MCAGYKSRDSVPVLVEKYLEGGLVVDEFVTHVVPLEDINRAFGLMHAGERCSCTHLLPLCTLFSLPCSVRSVVKF